MVKRHHLIPTLMLTGTVGAAALVGCSSTSGVQSTADGNASASTRSTGTSGTLPGGPGATAGGGSNGGGGGSNSGGGGSNGGGGGGGSSAPTVVSVNVPTANCKPGDTTVPITVTYKVANAKRIEYLAPGASRPGADNATGSVMFTFDCSKESAVYKIRGFNEFNGSDAKDPGPYYSFTVKRSGGGTASSSSSSSSTSTTKPASSSSSSSTSTTKM